MTSHFASKYSLSTQFGPQSRCSSHSMEKVSSFLGVFKRQTMIYLWWRSSYNMAIFYRRQSVSVLFELVSPVPQRMCTKSVATGSELTRNANLCTIDDRQPKGQIVHARCPCVTFAQNAAVTTFPFYRSRLQRQRWRFPYRGIQHPCREHS